MEDNFLHLRGIARNIKYKPCLGVPLTTFDINTFNSNERQGFGIISLGEQGNSLGFSKWVSPKRTRSYPFARIYNTYHLPKKVTIIPIIKDEGMGGDNDRINFITFSWMNLLNVYIILTWYEDAKAHRSSKDKITSQRMNNEYVKDKLIEISSYHQTALHWNTMHFETGFEDIFKRAVESYQNISRRVHARVHPPELHLKVLEQYRQSGKFNKDDFKLYSLPGSLSAAQRELSTRHELENLIDGKKGFFSIINWLGGEYHLTADEVYLKDGRVVIQESKNTTRARLPSRSDIQDGLFKLILFANLDELYLADDKIGFVTRLKLTGNFRGSLVLPYQAAELGNFCQENIFSGSERLTLDLLTKEVTHNPGLEVLLTGNL